MTVLADLNDRMEIVQKLISVKLDIQRTKTN